MNAGDFVFAMPDPLVIACNLIWHIDNVTFVPITCINKSFWYISYLSKTYNQYFESMRMIQAKIQPMMNIILYCMGNFFLSNAANILKKTRKCMFFRVQPESIEVYANDWSNFWNISMNGVACFDKCHGISSKVVIINKSQSIIVTFSPY